IWPDAAAEGLRLVMQRALDRAARILDPEGERADRRTVQQEERMRKCVLLGIEDEIDVALAVQRYVLGAVGADMRKAHRAEHFGETRAGFMIDRELDEFDAVTYRRLRRCEGARRGHAVGRREQFFLEQQQGAHGIDGGRARWCGAELVVEDFQRNRA